MGFSKSGEAKSVLENTYDIDNEYGRALIKQFEKELKTFKGKRETIVQAYHGSTIENKCGAEDLYLLSIGAIVFHENECGYRVVSDKFSEAKMKMKQLRRLEERREWVKNNP